MELLAFEEAQIQLLLEHRSYHLQVDIQIAHLFDHLHDCVSTIDCLACLIHGVDSINNSRSLIILQLHPFLRDPQFLWPLLRFADQIADQLDFDSETIGNLFLGQILYLVLIDNGFLFLDR